MTPAAADPHDGAPDRAGVVLAALILVAAVANLSLSVANVALPSIGKHVDSSQKTLDLIAVGYSPGYHAADTPPVAPPDVSAGPPKPTPA